MPPPPAAADPAAGELWPGGPLRLPVTFTVDGAVCRLPALPTRRLLYLLAAGSWWELVPNALPRRRRVGLMRRLYTEDDPFDYEHLWRAATTLLGRLAGTVPPAGGDGYWPARRISQALLGNWMLFEGWCAAHGFDPLAAPLHRTVAAGYHLLRESCRTDAETTRLESRLWAPPDHQPAEVPLIAPEVEAAQALAVLDELMPGESPDDLALPGGWDS